MADQDQGRTRRRVTKSALVGFFLGTAGCIEQAQDVVIGGRERDILDRYTETYEMATQSVDLAERGIEAVDADEWRAAKPNFQESQTIAQESIEGFRETYDEARFIANTKVQRSVTESWTKCLKVRDFTTEAIIAVNYIENGKSDTATLWYTDEAWPHWKEAQNHQLVPPSEIRRELDL